ncbi:acyltransferase family protein [Vampirovibrio chlorellavorus]|uniref:acyltransferase family protein n=1 Tax=Vampirovibrio chlorellavorus TaxID=758823 RepID=UPI0026ED76E1|nr:acyltransferase [Vampirovibrio chlorellavorus]
MLVRLTCYSPSVIKSDGIIEGVEKSVAKLGYSPQLDGLRALAFFLVFSNHLKPLPEVGPIISPFWGFLQSLMGWGWMGVQIFFVLSGFLITSLLLQERADKSRIDLPAFFIKRALRIWPLYYLMILINFLILPLVLSHGSLGFGGPVWSAMCQTYLLPFLGFVGNFWMPTHDGVKLPLSLVILWSVCVEEQFYVFWGFTLARFKTFRALGLLLVGILTAAVLIRAGLYYLSRDNGAFYFHTLAQMDTLAVGAVIALLRHWGQLPAAAISRHGVLFFGLPVAYYAFLASAVPNVGTNHPSQILVFTGNAVFSGCLLLSLLYWRPASRWFSLPFFVLIGRHTYAMYLTHLFAFILAESWLGGRFHLLGDVGHWLLHTVLAALLTALFAFLSWHAMEKWFQRLRQSFIR